MEGLGWLVRPYQEPNQDHIMTIVITRPEFFAGEAEAIVRLFDERHIDRLHLRKPNATTEAIEQLLQQLPHRLYPLITIHDFYTLAQRYRLGGIHLTSRNPIAPADWNGLISTSCHSLDELARRRQEGFSYLSLSPIFDSISKAGYLSAFTREQLQQAHSEGLIDEHILALGGVTFARLPIVQSMGFGGGMILGDAWN